MLAKNLLSPWIKPKPSDRVPSRKGKEEFKSFSLGYKRGIGVEFQRWKVTMKNLSALQDKGFKKKKKRTSALYSLLELLPRRMLDFCTARHANSVL